ncbi:VanW family protein [Nocardioides sp. YIM 152315]|uniref:VanW family protein n=1 Tax=Nocardioides sp. YIM 152315 TaxID=3031760 RepID=UPI0023DA3F5D|nr:VanW family protein [Nocardioides sp. YIM 152315]MDF1603963.1 VanW family protein [Nocardioides sp. YIM 152315]
MKRPDPSARESAGGKVVLLVLGGLLLLAGGAYAAAYVAAGDKVPRGTSVEGVEIGGMTPADAEQALREGLAGRVDRPVPVSVEGRTATLSPTEAGLEVDYAATVADAGGGRSWAPGRLWDYWTGGGDQEPTVAVDGGSFDEALDGLADEVGTPATDGAVAFRGGEIEVTDPAPGTGFDPGAARAGVLASYLSEEDDVVELDTTTVPPEIDEAAVQAALDTFANPAMSAPVTLVFGDSPVQLRPREFSAALRMRTEGGALVPDLKTDKLVALVDRGVGEEDEPVDATVELVDGRPKVVPAKPGVTYDPDDVNSAFLQLVTQEGDARRMEVEATVAEPEFTTADAKALKIKEKVSSFTTYYPYAEYRNVNIGRAAEIVDGTVLEPGDVFSLNDIVGERTRENGFTEGFIISDGIFKEDLGGGVSQMATTTFNAMFFAGLKDLEHKPHSFYIDRYPVGREATVAWGAVDLRFENDTPYGVLVHATVRPATSSSQGVVTVSMYSTKTWDITTKTSERYNHRPPATRTLTTPDCYPNSGYSGFDVDVWRYFHEPGSDEVARTEKFHTSYTPSDTVVCKEPGQKGA